jgi:imidazolonepropionase-like amidohydrolase
MKRILLFFGLTAALGAQQPIVIRGARVVDGTGAPARAATVVIRGVRIEAVAANASMPAQARVIDAAGQTLLPGLFDLHTHLAASGVTGVAGDWGKNLKAYLACGVTTVNDYSTYGEMIAPVHRLLENGVLPGPRVNMAVRLSTPGGHGTEFGWGDFMTLTAGTPEEAHARMKTALAYRPDAIKIFTDGWRYGAAPDLTSMNLETLTAMVADAHAAGVKVFTHTVTLQGAKIAAQAGVDVLAHGVGDAPVDGELIGLLKSKGTFYVSTLSVYESKPKTPARALDLLDAAATALVAGRAAAQPNAARQKRWGFLMDNVRRLHQAGIGVGVGTDAGETATYHGYSALHEMELLVEAGMTPLEAIEAGTSVSARALGVEKQRGMIALGMSADLVLIDGRPDEKIGDIEKTSRVFFNGAESDIKSLEAAIQTAAPTPLPAHKVPALIDDMEGAGGRTALGTLRVNSTDAGTDHSTMMFLPLPRNPNHRALMIEARMAAKPHPFVRLEMPLTPGGIELADVSQYAGISFEVRGEGTYRLLAHTNGVQAADPFAAPFSASGEWQLVKVPFSALARKAEGAKAWTGRDVRALVFELSGAPESGVWLELDNVRFY